MPLNSELISQFAKLAISDKPTSRESTVYGTIVEYDGSKYVRLDGSDLLTPISSTTNVENNERVTVMIKDHTATVTGNLSSPAARTAEVSNIGSKIDEFEIVVADKVDTKELNAALGRIDDLEAEDVIIHKTLTANDASIKKLETDKLTAEDADLKYANIDFTNIGEAAMEYFYANSGLIQNVVVDEGTITGNLVGVTIRGDRIEGNTIVADKLVIKGDNGLYYKLNTDGVTTEAEQTEYNSLDGSIITAKSITATKISVSDLVAFDATIGGFHITENSIYSGVKNTVHSPARGIYQDNTGQMAFGDSASFIKYYRDVDGTYKLNIAADEIILASTGKTLTETVLDASGKQMTISFALSNAIERERSTITAKVHVWKNDEEITDKLPVEAFSWQRETGNATGDIEWNMKPEHIGVTEITIGRDEIGKSCQIRCTLSEASGYGSFKIEDGGIVLNSPEGFTDEFELKSAHLYGEDYYYIEDGFVKRHGIGSEMYVTATVFDHSLVETSHITVKDSLIDVYSGGRVQIESGADIQLKSGSNMTVEANSDIEMKAGSKIKMESGSDITIESGGKLYMLSGSDIDMASGSNVNVKSGGNVNLQSGAHLNVASGGNINLKSGGTFTVASEKFKIDKDGNVTIDGTVTADDGNIGGWDIKPGALSSGSNGNAVSLSTADTTYAMWAGAEASNGAPFRVAKDGSVFLTKLYVTDENGVAQPTPVNLRQNYWKMDSAWNRAVKSMSVNNDTLTIVLNDGTSVNFKKAATDGQLIASGNGATNFTVGFVSGYQGVGTGTTIDSGIVEMRLNEPANPALYAILAYFEGALYGRYPLGDFYETAHTAGQNAVTLSSAGWDGSTASNTIKASNGKTIRISVPNVSLSKGSWINNEISVGAYYGSSGRLGSITISGEKPYSDGYDKGVDDGHATGYTEGLETGHETGYTEGQADGYTEGYKAGWAAAKAKITRDEYEIKGPGTNIDTQEVLYTVTANGSLNNITNTAANYFNVNGYAYAYINGTMVNSRFISKANTINVGQK